jgi:hypothetical protein
VYPPTARRTTEIPQMITTVSQELCWRVTLAILT